jgi:ribonuclease HII
VRRTGHKLLKHDRKLGARLVAGTDEAGRGPLAGPLVVAGVLLDLDCLREHRARPFTYLNDSKQLTREQREQLFHAIVSCAEKVVVRAIPADEIDRRGLHRSNLDGLCAMLEALTPPAEACLVDGFRLGKAAPERLMRRMDALYPHYGFASHVGYITPSHTSIVRERGPSPIHRRSWRARAYMTDEELAALEELSGVESA